MYIKERKICCMVCTNPGTDIEMKASIIMKERSFSKPHRKFMKADLKNVRSVV